MEVCALRDAAPSFKAVGTKVYGISTDNVEAQARFAKAEGLDYPLLADPSGEAGKAYGVVGERRPYARRVTFVVDASGVVRHVFQRVNVRKHGEEVVAVLKTLGAGAGGDTGHTGVLDEAAFKALHELKGGESPKLVGKDVKLGDGNAYLSLPRGQGPFPGVIVIHEWWGLNAHVKHWADRLAADGYAALAVDMYGGEVAKTSDDAMRLMQSVDEEAGATVVAHGLQLLKTHPSIKARRVAAMGWCFGGGWSLRAALRFSDLDAAVIYYGRLKTDPALLKTIKAAVLGVFGNKDRGIPPASVDAFEEGLKAAGITHAIHRYDANHAFANPSSARYDAKSAADAWGKVRAFLAKRLKP